MHQIVSHILRMWRLIKESSDKMLPSVGIEPRPLITSDSKSNTVLSGITMVFACKSEPLGSLYSHAPMIMLNPLSSCKSKNQVGHELFTQ